MINLRNSLGIVLALFVCAQFASANPISTVTLDPGSINGVFDSSVTVTSSTVAITPNLLQPALPPSSATWTVNLTNPSRTDDYAFTVSVTNNTGGTIDRIDLELLNLPVGSTIGFLATPAPTSTGSLTATTITPTLLAYTGTLANGNSTTMGFTVTIKNPGNGGVGSFSFRLTATPEPTSLIFGAIGMSLAGGAGFFARRRRQRKKELTA